MLGEEGYQPSGKVVRVEDLDIYVVGSGDKCVVWNYDIFGFNSGRTKELADLLAESGFLVVMPDYFRGTFQVTKT
jgi:dienelactone hydrolase